MMELRPPDPVQLAPPMSKPSYAEMANGGVGAKFQPNFSPRAYNKSFQSVLMGEKTLIVKDMRSSEKFQNAPAAIFYDDEVDALAAPLQRTLVGSALLNLAKSLGPPIQMDEATAKGTRPSKARVCIEFDCLVEPPTEIWVQVRSRESGKNLSGYWQLVTFEKMAAYCTKCSHVGHHMDNCMLLDNNVRPRQPLKHVETAPKNDTKIASNNNLKPATEGGKKIKRNGWRLGIRKHHINMWNTMLRAIISPPLDKGKSIQIPILLNEGTSTKTQDSENVCDTPLGNLIEEESRKLDKDDLIQPQDKGKSIETDNHPILVDDAKTQDREIDKETPTGSLTEIKTPVSLTASDNLKKANLSSKFSKDSMVGDSQPIGLCGLNTNDTIPSNCNTIDSTKSLNSDSMSIEFENHPRILTRQNSEGDVQSHFSKKDLGKKNLHAEFNETAIAKVIDAIPLNICFND
ncbi:TA11-LIKE NON-LTR RETROELEMENT PROTEIN-RELATED [Salix viminalis]|uniref:TA11-LIKE NON-LTR RETROELEMENT PROTEIN-RELATED n=1 Tax=Salix viminalis TaxID=40686 RepID=A0A9Q0UJR4_SALVM|nr:TA11-LIKE NON-LTR RETROELEMENT PROTEIN-RELATED [Salix viminalis]